MPANCLQTRTQRPKGALGAFLSLVRPEASPEYRQQEGELRLDQRPGISNFLLGFAVFLWLLVLGRVSGSPGWPQTQFAIRAGIANLKATTYSFFGLSVCF